MTTSIDKKIIAISIASAFLATPAIAQEDKAFQGAKVAAVAGYDNTDFGFGSADDFTYGATAGYDLQSGKVVYGVEAEITDSTRFGIGRDFSGGVRLGYALSDKALLYVKGGYTNYRVFTAVNLDGARGGVGLEYNVSDNVFARGEYRYSNYQFGVERHQAMAAVGVKF